MNHLQFILAFSAMTAVAPALAQSGVQPTSPPVVKAAPDQVVCERQEDTGSRLTAQKVCHTRSQWAQIRRDEKSNLLRAQAQRGQADLDGH